MEDALALYVEIKAHYCDAGVLILVLMEDALAHAQKHGICFK